VLTATLIVLAVLLVAAAALLLIAAMGRRARRDAPTQLPSGPQPKLGSPAQVWLERGESAARRLRDLGEQYPALSGAGDDADAVLIELRWAAGEVARLDQARARLPTVTLKAQQQRLDAAIAAAGSSPVTADLRSARNAVAASLALAAKHQAARDALLARMRAAVAGMEQADAELRAVFAEPSTMPATATAALSDRLAGLRAGLAEVRAISAAVEQADQGHPGDLPGSVEPPPRT
jgi:truncated hemoglobin YjbI